MNTTRSGRKYKFGDVIVAFVQFTGSSEIKTRPALVLFEEYENIVLAGITSNPHMQGIPLTKEEGAIKNSIIKLNYIMTITEAMIKKYLFTLSEEKKRSIREEFVRKLR
ncbi:MAG: type II toxin-antitoxin system PemK/MazF family toxin [Nanoarchaeota archaeon]